MHAPARCPQRRRPSVFAHALLGASLSLIVACGPPARSSSNAAAPQHLPELLPSPQPGQLADPDPRADEALTQPRVPALRHEAFLIEAAAELQRLEASGWTDSEASPANRLAVRVFGPDGQPYSNRPVVLSHRPAPPESRAYCGTGAPALLVLDRHHRTDSDGRLTLQLGPDWPDTERVSWLLVQGDSEDERELGANLWIRNLHRQRSVEVQLAPKRLIAAGRVEGWQEGLRFELQVREFVGAGWIPLTHLQAEDPTRRRDTCIVHRGWIDADEPSFEVWGWPIRDSIDLRFEASRYPSAGNVYRLLADIPVGSGEIVLAAPVAGTVQAQVEATGQLPINLELVVRSLNDNRTPAWDELRSKVAADGSVKIEHVPAGDLDLQVVLVGSGAVLARHRRPGYAGENLELGTLTVEPPAKVLRMVNPAAGRGPYATGRVSFSAPNGPRSHNSFWLPWCTEEFVQTVWLDDTEWSMGVHPRQPTSPARPLLDHLPMLAVPVPVESGSHDLQALIRTAVGALAK